MSALLADSTFSIPTAPASSARSTAKICWKWIQCHHEEVAKFQSTLITSFMQCFNNSHPSHKLRREKMWSTYHGLRSSNHYISLWGTFLGKAGISEVSPIFVQFVGHFIFKKLIHMHYPVDESLPDLIPGDTGFTYEEVNAIRYAAGWVARALKDRLVKSAHPLKDDLQLCLWDLLDDGDEGPSESKEWVELSDRGGLTRVNNITFELFTMMEKKLRKIVSVDQAPSFNDDMKQKLVTDDDVQFFWCMISSDWDSECTSVLLEMVVSQWVKIRGFSYASGWIEKVKETQKRTLQKSKGVRKQLLPMATSKQAHAELP